MAAKLCQGNDRGRSKRIRALSGFRADLHCFIQCDRAFRIEAAYKGPERNGCPFTDEHYFDRSIRNQEKGVKKWFKSFAEPVAVIAPINVLEIFIRPLSLCMRLFGNVLGAFVIMELIKQILPVGLPLPFSFYFDIFDGLIQAYVFVFLTSLFIKEAVE